MMDESFKGRSIVIVDDDPDIVSTLSDYFKEEGFEVDGVPTAEKLFKFLHTHMPDLIILDIILPDMNGFQVCKNLKESEQFSTIPIIILSGQDRDADQIFGLDLGAIDYLVKPYSPDVLLAKAKTILKRVEERGQEKKVTIGVLEIDLKRYQVKVEGEKVGLTPTEFKMLQLLSSKPGVVFTRANILFHVWGNEEAVTDRVIDVHIRHLREKLGKAGSLIEVVRSVGYKLKEEG
ncbi:response regulator transcription factor [Candidatus Omnitrophota bacterium]